MGHNPDGKATWNEGDLKGAAQGVPVGMRAPRTDIRPEEKCYVALNNDGLTIRGFIKEYPDGSASYWREEGEQAKAASSLDDAQRKLFAIEGAAHIVLGAVTASGTATVK